MRDQRDPSKLGDIYLAQREANVPIAYAVLSMGPEFDQEHQGPVEKYGKPGTKPPVYATIRVV